MSENPRELIGSIFARTAVDARNRLQKNGTKFVHYTSSEAMLSIIRNQEVWLRNANCMNDISEIQHGFRLLKRFFAPFSPDNPDLGQIRFRSALDAVREGAAQDALDLFNGWMRAISIGTYVFCLSEHPREEDITGRLSMWRGYGRGKVGVAAVLNREPFERDQEALRVYGSPVSYVSDEGFYQHLRDIAETIEANVDALRVLSDQQIVGAVFNLLLFAVTCSKHPGFAEEREWRLVTVPEMHGPELLRSSVESVAGIPQKVFKIPLKNRPDKGIDGIELDELLYRIIIGPTDYPYQVAEAIVEELTKARVRDANSRVFVSDIPLRT
jgi:hypothetical protein